jgi:predicted RNA-binding Zn ribbon-like protein
VSGDTTPMTAAVADEGLCLDFANTLAWRGSAEPTEKLTGLADLLRWLHDSAGLSDQSVEAVRQQARDNPGLTERLFAEAIELREAIYRIFAAAAAGNPGAESDLAALNHALEAAPRRTRLVRQDGGYAWAAVPFGGSVPALLTPVLWSAADLLIRLDRLRVRRCANDECLWLFIDHSKGGTRRWCDMTSCGNRAKARRHYLRTKPGPTPGDKPAR